MFLFASVKGFQLGFLQAAAYTPLRLLFRSLGFHRFSNSIGFLTLFQDVICTTVYVPSKPLSYLLFLQLSI